ncbi:hypothetical protein UFOVP276_41 [uncultured Caudovirales phage]|uniref:Tail sheath protein n=1 Tax=uncultured Caudovirales phage TaxID=2100421 RepID=A0A6J5LIZ5_9CAUD|nr:hypothetical protein UFOVP127_178 [uncultured Caudovirales phage]CAB4134989.1 hypothetical protein UFOVP276_41 [uncultured Caudovirales phage]
MATELLQPGVTVIQEFRTVSPTIVTPTLVPCAVAPAFQIVDAMVTNAAGSQEANSEAVVSVPAILVSTDAAPYASLNATTLKVSINNGPTQTFTFTDPTSVNLDAGQVCDQIASQSPAGFGAYVVTSGASTYVQLRTTASGDGQYLKILDGTANSVLGFASGYLAEGVSSYKQTSVRVEQLNFPDPRGIADEMSVNTDSIRAFINTGKALKEILRTESFLRNKRETTYTSGVDVTFPGGGLSGLTFIIQQGLQGAVTTYTFSSSPATVSDLVIAMNALLGTAAVVSASSNKIILTSTQGYIKIGAGTANTYLGWTTNAEAYTLTVVDDGDGDSTSPIIKVAQDNFTATAGVASITGTATISTEVAINNLTLQVSSNGAAMQEIAFSTGPISGTTGAASTGLDGKSLFFTVNGTSKTCTFVTPSTLADAVTQINTAAGTTVCYLTNTDKVNFQVGGATATLGGDITLVYGGTANEDTVYSALKINGLVSTPTPSVVHQTLSLAEIITATNTVMGAGFASNATNKLKLQTALTGAEAEVRIGRGTANSILGLTNDAYANGSPFPPKVGDDVYADGVFIGKVSVVAPGAVTSELRLDRDLALAFVAQAMYIESVNIPSSLPADRPTPNLVIDTSGAVLIKMGILRDTEGFALANASGALMIAYKALRLDVTSQAAHPALLNFSDITTLEAAMSPISTDNPLGLMLYFMMLNAPGVTISGVGVNEVSAANPDGTVAGYAGALTFLEPQEVYALAPASQDPVVHQTCVTHVTAMSEPEAGGERIVFINPEMPSEDLPTLVGSGDGDSLPSTNWFDTHVSSLAADLLAQGINPIGTIPVSAGLYLTVAGSTNHYNIAQISGTRVLVRVAFSAGDNTDGFYSTSNLSSSLIGNAFSLYIRGTALVTSTGLPDYERIALAYQKLGQTYLNRRVRMVAPERVGATIGGVEALIPGYYMCSALAGMVGQLPPQQGFTNYPITGFTRAVGSNEVFSRRQMNVGAAGGTWWVTQSTAGAPLQTRMQVTTDLTSIETREHSITSIVDFVAKFMRVGLRNFIGRFNITHSFLDSLSTVVQGQLGFLRDAGILVGGDLNNIVQDSTAPDTVLIDVTLDVPYPCNYVRLTLVL